LNTKTNRTKVVFGSVAFDHMTIVIQQKDGLWSREVRPTRLSGPMTEQFYRYKLTNISWQGWQSVVQTLDDEEFEKLYVVEVRQLLDEGTIS
jgi:hypothetical protein